MTWSVVAVLVTIVAGLGAAFVLGVRKGAAVEREREARRRENALLEVDRWSADRERIMRRAAGDDTIDFDSGGGL